MTVLLGTSYGMAAGSSVEALGSSLFPPRDDVTVDAGVELNAEDPAKQDEVEDNGDDERENVE